MPGANLSRRGMLRTTAVAAVAGLAAGAGRPAEAGPPDGETPFAFEITRSEAEWRAMLSPDEYNILREGGTEWPMTHPLWNDYSLGDFKCRGCALHLYGSEHRAEIDKGWVFFYHAQPDSVLTDIDTGNPYRMAATSSEAMIEAHCRRCGSHLGHILMVDGAIVHCINGTSLQFESAAA